jgi:tetratricopeptide (TPR) repeat protein
VSESRWQRLERLFEEGLGLVPDERGRWLAGLELDDEMRAELAGMLVADERSVELTHRFDNALGQAGEMPLAGTRVGPYRLLRELGSGGMGLVYLAERADRQFQQQVAIKLIRGFALGAAQQLRHERQILADFSHPNIARLLDGGETPEGQPYLVMEYVPGELITEACHRLQLSVARRVELLRDLARAAHYAHQRLIVHRDIKPANVLLRDDGRAVLLDFGIAKLVDPESRISSATQPWFTPAYASPEQRRGQPLSTATDVYALGLLLSELLTDRTPEADAAGSIAPPSSVAPAARRSALRGDLDRIVLRATAPDPERRYPSAEALADDLQRHLVGQPVHAVPDSLRYRAQKLLRRHPMAASGALVAVALLATSAWRLADERDRALRAEREAVAQTQAAEAVTHFLIDVFREADPRRARGASLSPTELIDRGRRRIDAESQLTGAHRVRLLDAFGEIYANLGQPAKATDALRDAIASARDAHLPLPEQAAMWARLGSALQDRAVYAEAEIAYSTALDLRRRLGNPQDIAEATANLGLILSRQNRISEAEPLLRDALAQFTALHGPDHADTLQARVFLAEMLRTDGRYEQAEPMMQEAVAGLRRRLAPDDERLVSALGFQAELLREVGKRREAEAVLLEVLQHRGRWQERDSNQLALVHSALGSVYYEDGRTREAVEQLLAALRISERILDTFDPSLGIDYNNVAALYEEMGDYEAAEPLMRRAITIAAASAADQPLLHMQYRQNLGRLLMLAGKPEEARDWLARPIDAGEGEGFRVQRWRQRLHLAEWERRYGSAQKAREYVAEAEKTADDVGGVESARYPQLLRTRALLERADGQNEAARRDLEQALTTLRAARGESYVGVGELLLDLAELDVLAHDDTAAKARLKRARAIFEPVLAPTAPQRARLEALAAAVHS